MYLESALSSVLSENYLVSGIVDEIFIFTVKKPWFPDILLFLIKPCNVRILWLIIKGWLVCRKIFHTWQFAKGIYQACPFFYEKVYFVILFRVAATTIFQVLDFVWLESIIQWSIAEKASTTYLVSYLKRRMIVISS